MHNTPFSPKLFTAEVRDKQVYIMVADDYCILWIITSEQLKFTWNTRTVNWCESSHCIMYHPTFSLNRLVKIIAIFTLDTNYSNILGNSKN